MISLNMPTNNQEKIRQMKKEPTGQNSSKEFEELIGQILGASPGVNLRDLSVAIGFNHRRLSDEKRKGKKEGTVTSNVLERLREKLAEIQHKGVKIRSRETDLLKKLHADVIGLTAGLMVVMEAIAEVRADPKRESSKEEELKALEARRAVIAGRLLRLTGT